MLGSIFPFFISFSTQYLIPHYALERRPDERIALSPLQEAAHEEVDVVDVVVHQGELLDGVRRDQVLKVGELGGAAGAGVADL